MSGNSSHRNREIPSSPDRNDGRKGRSGKGSTHKPDVHDDGKSDGLVVPRKRVNKGSQKPAEPVEERRPAEGNAHGTTASRTQGRNDASSGLERIRQAAQKDRKAKFTALLHHVTIDLLHKSFKGLNRKASPGIDDRTWQDYEVDLDDRLRDLKDRVHRGAYRALPSKRTFIPKADGTTRPLGIASIEDKIVQQALVTILNQIYEEDFLGFSYGFRPGRNQHNALDAVWVGITRRKVNWVLDLDIQGFFDTIDHGWLIRFLEHRIADSRVLRLIRKWLRAGVSENGEWSKTTLGTPQGAVISPLLANIYLHYALDLWADQWRRTKARGDVIIVRYADDVVMGFQNRAEAERFKAELQDRLAGFGLNLHPDKTRLIEFGRFAIDRRATRGQGKPQTFSFLGFTHICARTKKTGKFTVKRKSQPKRVRAKLKDIKSKLMQRLDHHVDRQGAWLGSVVRGWFQYHAVPGNFPTLTGFKREIERLWHRTLRRRSQQDRTPWNRLRPKIKCWIPNPRILHPYPNERLIVKT